MKKLLKIEDLKNELNLGDLGEQLAQYDSGYVSDIIAEIADSNVDIYNNDLMEWAKGNTSYIEDAIREFGTPEDGNGHPDFMRLIMQGQYYMYEQDLYNNIEDILKYWAYDYIENKYNLTELTEEQNEEIEFYNYNNVDKLEEIEGMIEDIFESEVQ